MCIPIEGRLKWRQTAPFHVQLELANKPDISLELDEVRVHGQVVKVFRTDGRLAIGDRIVFKLWVCREGKEPTGPAYVYYDDFMHMAYMEAYLYGNPPECALAAYEFSPISAPSEEPVLTIEDLEKLLVRPGKLEASISRTPTAKRWWQFWK
jgi:hypothetical protein